MAKPTPAPATTPTNAGNSNKSTPTPTVAAPKNVTKWVLLAVVAFAVIVGIALLVSSVKRDRAEKAQKSAQALSQQQSAVVPVKECTKSNPCTPTGVVLGKPGYSLCWDPSFWENLPKLGYHTSRNGVEKKYTCTREQVMAGNCTQTAMDSFRFDPESGVDLPKYWFVREGATQC